MRFLKAGKLGSGAFAEVYKAIDVDTGKLMAVKILRRPEEPELQNSWRESVNKSMQREIGILSRISHPNIVEYITSQGCHESDIEIFMGLNEGSLEMLIQMGADKTALAEIVLPQMLAALDFLAYNDVIHRDVKPANILYTSDAKDGYRFQLGDFGLANRPAQASTMSGTLGFLAPEMLTGDNQACKVDSWSLHATILWVLNINGFREMSFKNYKTAQDAVVRASSNPMVAQIQEMAVVDPLHRASPAQMLFKLYDGKGLSTPRNQIQPLHVNPSAATAAITTGTGTSSDVFNQQTVGQT